MKKLFKQSMVIFLVSFLLTGYSNELIHTSINNLNILITKSDSIQLNSKMDVPVITNIENKVYLYILDKKDSNVIIEIYFQDYELAYKEKHTNVSKLSRLYDFTTSQKGKYTFIIKVDKEVHKEIVTIK